MEIKSLDLILELINGEYYDYKAPFPYMIKYKEGYVFDENKSVKWNKEEVERQNQARLDAIAAYDKARADAEGVFRKDVIESMIGYHPIGRKEAERIYWEGYDRSHSEGYYDVVLTINSLLGLYMDLLNYRNNS
jgi:hypothetical protein